MSNGSNTPSNAPSLIGFLGLLFLGLKLGHVISWSWWLVTLPFWGGLALFAVGAVVIALFGGTAAAVKGAKRRRRLAKSRANPPSSGRRISIAERRSNDR